MLTKEELPECLVATTVALIGSKWKLLIIRNLLQRPWRFNELRKGLDGISQKVLTDSLRSMEADGLITRTVYPEVPSRVEYALSDLGQTLKPILDSMVEWGNAYNPTNDHKSPPDNPVKRTCLISSAIDIKHTAENTADHKRVNPALLQGERKRAHLSMRFFPYNIRNNSKHHRKQKRSNHIHGIYLMAEIFIKCCKNHTKSCQYYIFCYSVFSTIIFCSHTCRISFLPHASSPRINSSIH